MDPTPKENLQRTRHENKVLIQLELEFEDRLQALKTDPGDIEDSVAECEICHLKFIFESALKRHMRSHEINATEPESAISSVYPHTKFEKKFICSCCKKQYFDQGSLDRHEILHNNPDGTFTCIKCRDVYSSKEELIEHTLEHAYDEEEDVCCLECGNILSSKRMLDIHMRIHFGQLPFACSDQNCKKKFQTASGLESHLKRDHYFEFPHQCIFCLESFRLPKKFKDHMLKNHATLEPPSHKPVIHYKCKHCPEKFTDLKLYHKHSVDKHKNGLRCVLCYKEYTSQRILKAHLQIHEGRKYECPDCDLKFVRASERNRHLYTHGVAKKHQCDECSCSFMQHYMLLEHKEVNHQGKRYYCDFCGKVYKTRYTFMVHVQEHIGSRRRIQCNSCEGFFSSKSDLQRHVDVKHATDFLECPECQVWCKNRVQLAIHMRKHKKGPSFKCHLCEKVYTSEEGHRRHLEWHQNNTEFICEHCGLEYLTYECLKTHKQYHKKKKGLQCFKCMSTFESRELFDKHVQEHMTLENERPKKTNYKDKPITCDICGRWTRGKWWYDVHMRTHTNERPFQCNICSHSAKTNASLKKHIQTHLESSDPDLLTYSCPDCNKTFREKKTLQIHSYVHSGERPICCEICGKTFVTNYNHKQHQFKHIQKNETVENFPQSQRELIASHEIVRCRNMVIKKRSQEPKQVVKNIEPPKRVNKLEAVCEDEEIQEIGEIYEEYEEDSGSYYQADLDRDEEINYEDLVVEEHFEDDSLAINNVVSLADEYCIEQDLSDNQDPKLYVVQEIEQHDPVYQITEVGRPKKNIEYEFEVTEMKDPEEQEEEEVRYYVHDEGLMEHEEKSQNLPTQILSQTSDAKEELLGVEIFTGEVKDYFVVHDPQEELDRLQIPDSADIKVKSRFLRLSAKDDKRCIYCKLKIDDEEEMREHLEQHYLERPYVCKICQFRFKQKSKLQRHEKVHLGTKSSQCRICHQTFTRIESLKKHMQLHNGILLYKCDLCQKSFASMSGKKSHEYMCEKRKQEEETVDMIDYETLDELRQTEEIYLINEDFDGVLEQNQCGLCFKKFNHFQSLEEHLKVHKLEKLKCRQCNIHFENKGLLAAHFKVVHNKLGFGKTDILTKQQKNELQPCQICQKEVKRKYMPYHLASKHSTSKHRCPECKMSFSEFQSLKKHVLNIHSEKSFQCSMCSKAFAQQSSLKAHEKSHDEPKIPCTFCGLELNKSSMERHRQRHLVEKPINCKYCMEGFVAKSEYRVHLMNNHRNNIDTFDV